MPLPSLQVGDMKSLLPVLLAVKEKSLKLAVHLSEVKFDGMLRQFIKSGSYFQIPDRNEETLFLIRGVPLDRIGHGAFMHPEGGGTDEITQEVSDKKIPIGKYSVLQKLSLTLYNLPHREGCNIILSLQMFLEAI